LDQIIYRPLSIINPYTLALQRNYYYPLSSEERTMQEESLDQMAATVGDTAVETVADNPAAMATDTLMQVSKVTGDETSLSPVRTKAPEVITVESSLEEITEFLKELEDDEAPTQTQSDQTHQLGHHPIVTGLHSIERMCTSSHLCHNSTYSKALPSALKPRITQFKYSLSEVTSRYTQ
jgi:hypothetical protein